eukprot:SAG11_NODE_1030_length_6119_cov_7.559302_3_plen_99_part_00
MTAPGCICSPRVAVAEERGNSRTGCACDGRRRTHYAMGVQVSEGEAGALDDGGGKTLGEVAPWCTDDGGVEVLPVDQLHHDRQILRTWQAHDGHQGTG